MKANEMRTLAKNSVNKGLLKVAIEKCEADIKAMASRGENRLCRNPYFVYMGQREDRGVLDALIEHLQKNGFTVKDSTSSMWVGAMYISWKE